jgi:hypothetical protein
MQRNPAYLWALLAPQSRVQVASYKFNVVDEWDQCSFGQPAGQERGWRTEKPFASFRAYALIYAGFVRRCIQLCELHVGRLRVVEGSIMGTTGPLNAGFSNA